MTGDGAPLGEVCVSALDPATGMVDGRYTGGDGRWSMIVPPGSYVIQAIDCSPGRNYAGRFSVDATAPSGATPVVADGSQEHTNLDINLVQGASTSITGRVVTGNGDFPAACAVAVSPNTEPASIVQTEADGSFVLGPLNPGSYLVGLAGCDFSQDMPPGIVDPSDPSIVYPLQWSSGMPLTGENLWVDPAWVTAASGTPTDLGTICLQPCNRPEPPTTTEAPTTTTNHDHEPGADHQRGAHHRAGAADHQSRAADHEPGPASADRRATARARSCSRTFPGRRPTRAVDGPSVHHPAGAAVDPAAARTRRQGRAPRSTSTARPSRGHRPRHR